MKKGPGPFENYVHVNGLILHYLEWGNEERKPMLMLHGFLSHARTWDDLARELSSRFRIIALDQRGHGDSQWSEKGSYSIEDHFTDIVSFVEAMNLNKMIIMGHSMGGRNAILYTACRPSSVERLVLIDARPGNNHYASEALRDMIERLPLKAASFDEIVKGILRIYPLIPRDLCEYMVSFGFRRMPDGNYFPRCDMGMVDQSQRSSFQAEDLWPFLKAIQCPTLIVRGEGSPFLSREDAEKMCRLIPNAELREIPNATHMPAQENPSEFKRAILKFIP